MKKLLFIFLSFSISCTTYNQEKTSLENEQILVGKVNWNGFNASPYNDWFFTNYEDYIVDSLTLENLDAKFNTLEIYMFLGTWCSDSQLQVPQFYKILDYLEYNIDQLTVVALEKMESGKLESPQHEEADFGITHVPTFIFLRDGEEIGRITEYPNKTIEKDMVEIIAQ